MGFGAGTSINGLTNSTAIGSNATFTTSNTIQLGNGAITSLRCQVALTVVSDGRLKTNTTENVPGLQFISKLRPVTYNLISPEKLKTNFGSKDILLEDPDTKRIRTGFVAQDVMKTANVRRLRSPWPSWPFRWWRWAE